MASETHPHASTATVGVWIDAGSRYETDESNGAAHFLEHMAFKGTSKRSARELELEIEDMGGHLNAYTSREQTCYYAKVPADKVGHAVELLGDILQRSVLDEGAVARERDVILREMQEVEGMADEVVFDHLHATAFQHSPLGRTILGPASNVRAMTRQHLVDYIKTNYTAPRMVIAAAGAVDHASLSKAAEAAFGSLPSEGPSAADLVAAAPSKYTGSEVRISDPDMPQLHVALAFRGAAWRDADSVALMVAQTLLGSWDASSGAGGDAASPLAMRLSQGGLAKSFMAFNSNYHDAGLFGLYAVTEEKRNLDDLAWVMMKEMTDLGYTSDEAAVQRAKNQLKASILFAADGTTGAAEDLGRSLLVYGRRVSRAELFARIDAVDAAAIRAVAQRFVVDQPLVSTAMGNTQFLPDYQWLQRRTWRLRY